MQKDKIIRSEGRVELVDQPELPPLEDQDAKMNQPDSFPVEKLERDVKPNADAIGGKAVWNAAWLAFLRTKNPDGSEKLGWFAYGGCQVNLELFAGEFCDPRPFHDAKDYPVRSTVMQSGDDSWHVIEENKTIHPWQNEFKSPLPEYGYIASIFSKADIELRVREAEKDKDVDEGEIEVIDPATAKVERIKANDPRYYSADGFKARRYKGSSKPMRIPPFVWQQMSVGQRRKAIEREQKKIATEEAESKAKTSTKKKPSTPAAASPPEGEAELEVIPAMPTLNRQQRRHREKLLSMTGWQLEKAVNGLVARPVNRKEILSNPKAKESLDVEWKKLENKKAWIYESVREWFDVAKEAKKLGKKVHIGKVFEICVEKGSELPAGDPLRKFKGRTVFQGNNVRDENADVALFSELGSSFAWANPAYPKFRNDYHASLKEFQDADPNHPAAPAQYQLSRLGMMKNFMLVDNCADVKSKIVKGAVNIVRPPRELEGVIDELAQTDARRKAQPGTEAESCELRGYVLAPCAIVQNSDIAGLRAPQPASSVGAWARQL